MKSARKMFRLVGAVSLNLVLAILAFAISNHVAVAAGVPTITSMYIATSYGNDIASGNNGTTTTVTITGTGLTGVTGVTFLQGTVADPLITIKNIAPNGSTPDSKFKVDVMVDPAAAAGARNVTVTTGSGTSLALASGFTVYRATISVATPGAVASGSTFNVTINVNNIANLSACQFDLNFDNNGTAPNVIQVNGTENLNGVTDGLIHDVTLGDKAIPNNGWTFQPTSGTPSGTIRVLGNMGNATKSATGSGYLAQISFLVTGAAGAGASITLSDIRLINNNADHVNPDTITNGSITVIGPAITNTSLPEATAGVAYNSGSLTATGGTAPYTWSASGLPAGLVINTTNGNGVISGTTSASGTFPVSITATDSQSSYVIKQLNLKVYAALQITTASLPEATQNVAYAGITVSATGGKTPYNWSINPANPLPAGLNINASTGAISGTPTVSGSFNVTLVVTDSFSPVNSTSTTLALRVYPVLVITTSSPLPAGVAGNSYSTTVTAGGGKTPYTWSASGLPAGLTIGSASGTISGTPTAAGDFTINVTVTDAFSPANSSPVATLTLHIGQGVTITTTSLPEATQNATYSGTTVSASGGIIPYTWSATGLPAGLTLNFATGAISGTPTASGTFAVDITVTDSSTPPAKQTVTLNLQVYPVQLPTLTSLNPNSGAQGATLTGVVITGTNLAGATVVTFSGSGVTASNLSVNGAGTQLTATITIAANATLGQMSVTVTIPGGTSASLTAGFSVTPSVLRVLPAAVRIGQTFNVSVTFTALSDNFNAIGLSDFVTAGWAVLANNSWNTPTSDTNNVTANHVEYIWNGPYAKGNSFTAVYQVTVSANATPGTYSFGGGTLLYYVGSSGPTTAGISGNSQVQVVNGATVHCTTYEGKGIILSGVTLTLDGNTQVISGSNSAYQLIVPTTGSHTVVATKTGYRSQTQTINITDLTGTYSLDFKASYGLVPNAPDISYVLACINRWKYPPADGTGLDISKVLSVINAWKFPVN